MHHGRCAPRACPASDPLARIPKQPAIVAHGPGSPAATERVLPPDRGCAMTQLTIAPFRCRFDTASAQAGIVSGPQGELCAFEFPGCRGCKFAVRTTRSVEATEDPLLSMIWNGYVHCSQLRDLRG
jgi:hypothetical protein